MLNIQYELKKLAAADKLLKEVEKEEKTLKSLIKTVVIPKLNDLETKSNHLEAFAEVGENGLIKTKTPNGKNIFLLGGKNSIFPFTKRNDIKIKDEGKLIDKIGTDKFTALGTPVLIPKTVLIKNLFKGDKEFKKFSNYEQTKKIYDMLPNVLRTFVTIESSNSIRLNSKAISWNEAKEILSKDDFYKKALNVLQAPNLEELAKIKEELQTIVETNKHIFLKTENNNFIYDEANNYYSIVSTHKLKETMPLSPKLAEIDEVLPYIDFKLNKHLVKEFSTELEKKGEELEEYGIEKQTILNFFKPVNTLEEFENFLKFADMNYDTLDYEEYIANAPKFTFQQAL